MTDKEIDELVGLTKKDLARNELEARKNNLLLTDAQVDLLTLNGIDPGKCGSVSELIYMINKRIEGSDEDEYPDLESLAAVLDERRYYEEINK